MMISHAKKNTRGRGHTHECVNKLKCVCSSLKLMIIAFFLSPFIQSIQSDLIIALIQQQQQFLIYENHVETAVVVEAVSIS